jgi:hypothetical protein
MKPIILDTRALLQEYAEYAPMFVFYQLGLKDLVREAVITRSFNSPYTTHLYQDHRYAQGFASKVMADFGFALDHHYDLYGEECSIPLYEKELAVKNVAAIGMIADALEEEVDALIARHLRTKLFEIAQEGSDARYTPRWIGPDLLIFVRTLSHREGHLWLPYPNML